MNNFMVILAPFTTLLRINNMFYLLISLYVKDRLYHVIASLRLCVSFGKLIKLKLWNR